MIPNQISIWFTQELCFGVYTNRTLWFSSMRNSSRLFMLFKMPSFPLMPSPSGRRHSSATNFTRPSDLWVFRPSQMIIYFLSGFSETSRRTARQKSCSFRVRFMYGAWITPSAVRKKLSGSGCHGGYIQIHAGQGIPGIRACPDISVPGPGPLSFHP